MTPLTIEQQLKALPKKPGIYQYKDASGTLLYVGKAKNLKNRVSSYFHDRANHTPRIQMLVAQVASVEVIVTETEFEALILEANMIKNYRPKYNILMKDDKKYPWLLLTDEPFPRLIITREPSKGGKSKCFGPYASPGSLYQTLQLIKKIFPLRKRKNPLFKDRPCMNYHVGSCLGPCQSLVTAEEYQKIVDQLVLFLRGHADDLLEMVQTEMEAASERMDFEAAGQLRDRYQSILHVIQRQRVMYDDVTIDQDIVGMTVTELTAYVALLKVRRGKLIQTLYYDLSLEGGSTPEEAYESFLSQYYQDQTEKTELPNELILQLPVEDAALLSDWLSQNKGRKVSVTVPQRGGPKKDILEMAVKNAEESRERARIDQETRLKHDPAQALIILQERLSLSNAPRRIECYDISHVSGTNTVASMVVFTDGRPDKKEYRRFKIQTVEEGKPDDFQSMLEVMTRRFTNREEKGWPDPDLVIIDGGKGQLSSAVKALHRLGITDQPIVSLAKKFEEVYLPGISRPVILERDNLALYLLQQIRDEAHRFAITYHRKLRGKSQTQSFLDGIPGIGEARKKRLLQHFDSMETLLKATPEEIAQATKTTGKTARMVYSFLHQAYQLQSAR
jgi:excinuclease ABC subunit C